MKVRMMATACILVALAGPAAAVADEPAPDRGAGARVVLAAKCSECHGPDLPRPKSGLTLDDPGRLATNRDLVTPGRPEESALWEVIRDGEMPPSQARAGPLAAAEKEAIRAWIASLAPAAPPSPPSQPQEAPGWWDRFGGGRLLLIALPAVLGGLSLAWWGKARWRAYAAPLAAQLPLLERVLERGTRRCRRP